MKKKRFCIFDRDDQCSGYAVQDLSDEEPEERPASKQKVGRKALVLSDSDDE